MRLKGQVALITGAGRGIGRETALLFAAEGARVVVVERDQEPALEVMSCIQSAGGEALFFTADVGDTRRCEDIMASVVAQYGDLNILVNNAGVTCDAVIHRMSDTQWDTVMNVHVKGCFNMCRAAAPYFRQPNHGGAIVNVSSVSAQKGNPGQTNYAAAKAAVIGFTRSLANEWARFGVRVNAVAFGLIETRMTRPKEAGDNQGIPSEQRQELIKRIPLGRPGTVREAARSILFLASDDSSYITGQTLNVNGGVYA